MKLAGSPMKIEQAEVFKDLAFTKDEIALVKRYRAMDRDEKAVVTKENPNGFAVMESLSVKARVYEQGVNAMLSRTKVSRDVETLNTFAASIRDEIKLRQRVLKILKHDAAKLNKTVTW
ncbi:hypothetical protein RUESEDTHA_00854 [Ruegeria sp. THAF57]|uniref:hypothetical protein n=1 Tax=Ruegeria sp. THAF57 TaxID=2744555 RepID=UPI0015E05E7B|nr:hypothetical protein [Ruegeria sp. THAF57]CAD0183977.1 hypothetical protein RUESEDTHA_00854 [Ruegeria sp. THAF57]